MFFGYSESKNIMSGSSFHTLCCVFEKQLIKNRASQLLEFRVYQDITVRTKIRNISTSRPKK
jgi:pyruvate carboxylase